MYMHVYYNIIIYLLYVYIYIHYMNVAGGILIQVFKIKVSLETTFEFFNIFLHAP